MRYNDWYLSFMRNCETIIDVGIIDSIFFFNLAFWWDFFSAASRDMEGQQFCLRWHNFQNTLLSSLPKLLDGGHLTDVTLSAGGRHIHAHRIILSACSYYFKELFKVLLWVFKNFTNKTKLITVLNIGICGWLFRI